MIKTKIIETTEKYDEDGKLVEKITREETTEDNEERYPSITTTPLTVPYNYGPVTYCNSQGTNAVVKSSVD